FRDEVAVDLNEVSGKCLTTEQVRHGRLDALRAACNGRNGSRRSYRQQQRVAQSVTLNPLTQRCPSGLVDTDVPRVELQFTARSTCFGERRMRPMLLCKVGRSRQRREVKLLEDAAV